MRSAYKTFPSSTLCDKEIRVPRFVQFGCHDTQVNLPIGRSKQRGEYKFVSEFERALLKMKERSEASREFASGREFALSGFGRADILLMDWEWHSNNKPISVTMFTGLRLTAIEAKLKDWRKGLMQAVRYRFFANQSILVLPPNTAAVAMGYMATFRVLSVGLWEYDPITRHIQKRYTPRMRRPLNRNARERAVHYISRRLQLR